MTRAEQIRARLAIIEDAERLAGQHLYVSVWRVGKPPRSKAERTVDGVRRLRQLERMAADLEARK